MKNIFLSALALFAFTLLAPAVNAQDAKTEASVKAFWNDIITAFENGDDEKMWAAYTEDAAEIGPDGSLTSGKQALRQNWEAFMKMTDAKPSFTYESPAVRVLTPDVAILTWDSNADIKIGGQQVGGKTKGMAVLRKINGRWFIEFDSLTPVMAMPDSH